MRTVSQEWKAMPLERHAVAFPVASASAGNKRYDDFMVQLRALRRTPLHHVKAFQEPVSLLEYLANTRKLTNFAVQCNREWPCNHCLKRKVADKCRFALPATNAAAAVAAAESSTTSDSRKRQASPDETDNHVIATSDFQKGSLGYHTADLLATLGLEDKACLTVAIPRAMPRMTNNQGRRMHQMTISIGLMLQHVPH